MVRVFVTQVGTGAAVSVSDYSFIQIYLIVLMGTWPSYLMDLLSLRLVDEVGARNYVRSSLSQWALSMTKI